MFFSLVFHFFFLSSCFSLQKTHTTTFHQNSARVITKITQKDCHHHPPLLKTQTTTKQPTTTNTKSQKKPSSAHHHHLPNPHQATHRHSPKPEKTHTQTDKQSINSTPKLKPFNTKTPNSNHQNKHRFKQTNKHNHQFNIDSNKHQ